MASRDELEAEAVKLGLASVSTYQNKKVVEKAIERVRGGEQAAVVDNEYQQEADATQGAQNGADEPERVNSGLDPEIIDEGAENDDDASNDDDSDDDDTEEADDTVETETAAPAKREKKLVKNRNNGHATKFDETGRPLFRA